MSRDSSPATLIGRLALRGSLESAPTPEMPVTTRGMWQTHRNLAASHSSSSGAVASSSRSTAPTSTGRQSSRRSARRNARAADPRRRSTRRARPDDDDDDDDDDEEEGDSDESDDESPADVVNEIMSTFTDTYRTPAEFAREVSPTITQGLDLTEYQRQDFYSSRCLAASEPTR